MPARTWPAHQRTTGDRSAAFASVSRGSTAHRFGAAMLTARFHPEQLVCEALGFIEGEMAGAPAVANGLADERGSKMTRVRIADGACRRRDGYAVDLLQVFRREIRVMKRQPFGHRPANAK